MPQLSLETYLIGLIATSLLGGVLVGLYVWLSQRGAARAPGDAKTASSKPLGEEELHETGVRLVSEATAILKIIRSQMAAGDRFSSTLAEADQKLPKLSDPDQVRMVIKFLIAENAKMQREQAELRSQLEHSQSQIEALRYNLAEVEEENLKDPLTGAANRRGFDLGIERAIAEATSHKTPLCLVMCDLDHFKKLNDTYGHPVGDEVLKVFASVLNENVRTGDTVVRYGGEEFAVILTRCDMQTAARVSERVRLDIASRKLALNRNGQLITNITASFGVAQFIAGDTPESLLKRADSKLYEAKNAGRNRVIIDRSALAA